MLNHGHYSTVNGFVQDKLRGRGVLIGEFSKASGLARDTIRFYEKIGLIATTETRRGQNKYKHYDRSLLDRMELIRKAKLLGFTLSEIGKLIRDWEGNRLSLREKRKIISDKIRVVDEKLEEILKVRRYLDEKLSCLVKGGAPRRSSAKSNRSSQKAQSKSNSGFQATSAPPRRRA